ncbi:MAG: hypothetical protein EA382_03160 [Spirochaetaceae bacterium]|nr:MAG: hypothetical protein EA382_03160 [Spirochaetaceae bacterium]
MIDCTIRNIPEAVEERLTEEARRRDLSIDQAALEAIARGLGLESLRFEYYELDDLEIVDDADG